MLHTKEVLVATLVFFLSQASLCAGRATVFHWDTSSYLVDETSESYDIVFYIEGDNTEPVTVSVEFVSRMENDPAFPDFQENPVTVEFEPHFAVNRPLEDYHFQKAIFHPINDGIAEGIDGLEYYFCKLTVVSGDADVDPARRTRNIVIKDPDRWVDINTVFLWFDENPYVEPEEGEGLSNGEDNYVFEVEDDFFPWLIKCTKGTGSDPNTMVVKYHGDAISVYSPKEDACKATEFAPAMFSLDTDICSGGINKAGNIWAVDLVVQKSTVRLITDVTNVITCNFDLGGRVSVSETTSEQDAPFEIVMKSLDEDSAVTTVTLDLYDTTGAALTEATIGDYVQLRAEVTNARASGEHGIVMWNCKARDSADELYYILLSGCGDGSVIPEDRGFFYVDTDLMSYSIFFKAFAMPSGGTVTFECSYSVCTTDDTCDGKSCDSSRRKKRWIEGSEDKYLTRVSTPEITLLMPGQKRTADKALTADQLITDEKLFQTSGASYPSQDLMPLAGAVHSQGNSGKNIQSLTPANVQNPLNPWDIHRPLITDNQPQEAETSEPLPQKWNVLTIGLLSGVLALSATVMILVAGLLMLWKKLLSPPQYSYHQTSYISPDSTHCYMSPDSKGI